MSKLQLKQGFAIGMIHLPPAFVCRNESYHAVCKLINIAKEDARILQGSGFDGIMIQNAKDVVSNDGCDNFTIAFLSALCAEIRAAISIPIGISVLKNDVVTALSIAKVANLQFVRCKVYAGAVISGEGYISACAAQAIDYRSQLNAEDDIELWSETFDLSSKPLVAMPFEEHLRWCKKMGADSFSICGQTHELTIEYCKKARSIVGNKKIIIGGGVNLKNLKEAVAVSDGMIVGSAIEKVPFTGPISAPLAQEFIRTLKNCQ